ncbi:unknown_gene_2567 [Phodopus roborovskii]|uniref:Unknown_gene_2567 protein n=1 Tax=Phodopus roborovskii TaxID=109678 RepID=A0AAV0A728_PHORO|nr:unknown_gene_2567 [Phodopus roborovskii]
MSKLSFRARALDASKPLPVFRCEDLPDLHEYASINRAVPQMPTGMEKEEESVQPLKQGVLTVQGSQGFPWTCVLQFCCGKLYCNTSVVL